MKGTIRTFTGRHINPVEPRSTDLCIEDIAHSLSLVTRWAGHSRFHYSVGLHSLAVALIIWKGRNNRWYETLWGLMHDGTEAYLGDMAKPIKNQMPEFELIEHRLMTLIQYSFGLPGPAGVKPDFVKIADRVALLMEAEQLFDGNRDPRSFGEEEWPSLKLDRVCKEVFFGSFGVLVPTWLFWKWLTPRRVEKKFLKTFYALTTRLSYS